MNNGNKKDIRVHLFLIGFLLLTLTCPGFSYVLANTDKLVDDTFNTEATGTQPSGYIIEETGGKVEIADLPSSTDKSLSLLDPGGSVIKVSKSFTPQTQIVTVELAFMQPKFGSTAKPLRLLDAAGTAAIQIETRKPNKFGYKRSDGTFTEFAEYQQNEWSLLTVIADVATQKADVYCDGELKLSQVPFMTKVENIGAFDSYTPGSSGKSHYIDNVTVRVGAIKPKAVVKKPAPSAVPPAPASAPAAKSEAKSRLITDLKVFSHNMPWTVSTNIQAGALQYTDRGFYIAKLPDAYAGCDWIQTACNSKNYFQTPLATFKVTADAEVYVAFDDRVVTKPEWLKDWVDTGDDIVNTEANPTVYSLYVKKFPANSEVVLGPNSQSSGCTQYMVLVKGPDWSLAKSKPSHPVDVPVVVTWKSILSLNPDWYGSEEAQRIADNVLLYQYNTGGWYKNIDMTEKLSAADKKAIEANKSSRTESTIDNNATTTQIRYLAKVYTATKKEKYKQAFIKGMNYLFAAQYPNGGWPQYYPEQTMDYYKRITYNDGAMTEVLRLMQSIFKEEADYKFVDKQMRLKAKTAFNKGIDCILKSQVRVNGKLTVWCAQHDEKTLAPASGRTYEKISLCSAESAGLVRLLMSLDNPSPKVITAIQSAVEWFNSVQLAGLEVRQEPDPKLERGFDVVVLNNPKASPIWARFYEIGTNRPIFCGRDGIIKYNLSEIEYERRTGYSWFNYSGASLIANDYPAWLKKCGITHNVLKK